MEEDMNNGNGREGFDLDALLHPAQAFGHPSEVVKDPDLTLNEKRAILASWASDVCAIEAAPEFRQSANGPPVRFNEIMDALKTLDEQAGDSARYRRAVRRRMIFERGRSRDEGGHGPMLH
jgi:hypothetical protein